jgi:alkylation response protein AidB-like acyl-CoA dehydrogenase
MVRIDESFLRTDYEKQLVNDAASLAERFKTRAKLYDETGQFPFKNFDELKENKFLSITVPSRFGGEGISLSQFLHVQETLAQGDGATALSLGWHLGIVMNLNEQNKWDEDQYEHLCQEVLAHQKLVNSAQTEKSTGSPTRGGKPQTSATYKDENWLVTGRKVYTTMAPALDYFIVSASLEGSDKIADFLIPAYAEGVSIEENWDTLGMRGTRSDDLILDKVKLPKDALVEEKDPNNGKTAQGWLLHIPACYLGIAVSALEEAIHFAEHYQPNSLNYPIKEVPEVRRKIGEMELKLLQARHFMYSVSQKWDSDVEKRDLLGPELAAVKYTATNAAVEIVDLAMRVVGAQSLFSSNPLQRLYRDVRAGIHNPPADDITISALANRAFDC